MDTREQREQQEIKNCFDTLMWEVPERYRGFSLAKLKYDPIVKLDKDVKLAEARWTEKLEAIKDATRDTPRRGIILYGEPSTGKTTIMAGIYRRLANREAPRRAVGQGQLIMKWLDMGVWATEAHNHAFGQPKPKFDTSDIQYSSGAGKLVLFMDELDKVPDKDVDLFNAFLRTAYNKEAIMFATTNLERQEFLNRFDKHVARRVGEDNKSLHVTFFPAK